MNFLHRRLSARPSTTMHITPWRAHAAPPNLSALIRSSRSPLGANGTCTTPQAACETGGGEAYWAQYWRRGLEDTDAVWRALPSHVHPRAGRHTRRVLPPHVRADGA